MEARYCLSAVGGAGAVRLRRAPLHLLSSALMDFGSGAECDLSLDAGRQPLYLDRAGGGGHFYVSVGPGVA